MRNVSIISTVALICFLIPFQVSATTNVALNKDVTLNGSFFTNGWGGGLAVDKQTVVDGNFLPQSTQWDQGAVWWDSNQGTGNSGQNIVIDLAGTFRLSSFIVQADDNDAYDLYYRNGASDPWKLAWAVPNYDIVNGVDVSGLQTRPNPSDNAEQYFLPSSIVATDLMIKGNSDSDFYYSVSEIQAFGAPVPEPGTIFLLGAGLIGLGFFGRRRTRV